jgi:ankyrin repeat protein
LELHPAASRGRLGTIDNLIRAGADLNVTDDDDLTPLMVACAAGKVRGSQAALRLIAAGADVTCVRSSDEMTAIKFAACSGTDEVIQALIDHGAEVDGPRGTDQTALMLAARENNVPALKALVRNGADIKRPCKLPWAAGRTAEGLAELEKRRAASEYLKRVRMRGGVR